MELYTVEYAMAHQLNLNSEIHLNDFESFERLLFTDEERERNEGIKRFKKFTENIEISGYDEDDCDYDYIISVPFKKPTTFVQYQINHYVLWGVIAYRGTNKKPYGYFDYNTEQTALSPIYGCYACQWTADNSRNGERECFLCPIWGGVCNYATCTDISPESSDLEDFELWDNEENRDGSRATLEDLREYAKNIMCAKWTIHKH